MTDAQVFRFILEDGGGSSSASSDSSRGEPAGASPPPSPSPPASDRPVRPGQIPPPNGSTSPATRPGATPDVVPGQIDRMIKDLLAGFEGLPIFGQWIRATESLRGPLLQVAAVSNLLRDSLRGLVTNVRPGQVQEAARPTSAPSVGPQGAKQPPEPAERPQARPAPVQPGQTPSPVTQPAVRPAGEQPSVTQPAVQPPGAAGRREPPQPAAVIPSVRPGQIGPLVQPVTVNVDTAAGQSTIATPAPTAGEPIVPQIAASPGKQQPVVQGQTPPPIAAPAPSIGSPQAPKPPAVQVATRAFEVQPKPDQPGVWQALDRLGQAMRDFPTQGEAQNYAWGQRKTFEAKHGESISAFQRQTQEYQQAIQPVQPGQIEPPQPIASAPTPERAPVAIQQPGGQAAEPIQPQATQRPQPVQQRPIVAGAVKPPYPQREIVRPGSIGPTVGPVAQAWHNITNRIVWGGDRVIGGARRAVGNQVSRLMQSRAVMRGRVRIRQAARRASQAIQPVVMAARGGMGRLASVVTAGRVTGTVAAVAGGAGGGGAGGIVAAGAAGAGAGGAPLIAGAIGALGPLAVVASGAAAALYGVTVAAKKVDQMFRERAEEVAPFSPALQLSRARNEIAQQMQDIKAARQLGPGLATYEDSTADIGRTLQRIQDVITGDLMTVVNEPVKLLSNLLKLAEKFDPSIQALKNLGKLAEFDNGFRILKEINKWLDELAAAERFKAGNDVLGIFGGFDPPPPLPITYNGKTYNGNGQSFANAQVNQGTQPGLGI